MFPGCACAMMVSWILIILAALSIHSDRANAAAAMTLDTVREALIRQEDTIIFSLIERARYPLNSKAYEKVVAELESGGKAGHCHGMPLPALAGFVIRDIEAVQAKAGRYQNPEEVPFFPETLPPSLVPPYNFSKFLYPTASSVNISKKILDIYFNKFLPLFVTNKGDDGNYAASAASDLACLQTVSKRIHYGRYVAEVKFRGAPNDYLPPIRSRDTDTLMKLLTDTRVEEMVKKRVKRKAMIFGQDVNGNVTRSDGSDQGVKYKVDPSAVFRLYDEWVIPLTKDIEVDYLLRRLDH